VKLRRIPALAAALLLLAGGCGETPHPTLAAEPTPPAALLGGLLDLDGVLKFTGAPSLLAPRSASKRIVAAEGGFVELHGFRVDIPAGALPADTVVTIHLPTDHLLAKRLVAEFGPHGVQFATPVTLTFPLAGVSLTGAPIEVARWENGGWTSLGGTVDPVANTLSSTTPSFSTYSGKYVLAGG
jgi:hypothetical protein